MTKKQLDKKSKKGHSEDMDDIVFDESDDDGNDALKKLREKLKKCVAEKQEYLDGWQRTKADFVNARKNDEEQKGHLIKFAKEGLINDMLSVVDNFEMAFANKDAWEKVDKNWRLGIEHIHTQFLKVLEEHGLVQFDPKEEQFDPSRHDSIESVVTKDKSKDNTVVEVLQKGYILNDKVIRPAKVKVGKYE